MKNNNGEVPRYYVEKSHEAIISPEVFDIVQSELTKRREIGLRSSSVGVFGGKIV